MEFLRNYSVQELILLNVCNVIRFCGRQNNGNMTKGMTYRMYKALQLLYFDLFLMKQYNFRTLPYV